MTTPTPFYKVTNSGPLIELTEFKKFLITWAQNQATGKRTEAVIGHTKPHHDRCLAKAESYDFVVAYLESIRLVEYSEPLPQPVKMFCPDTNRVCEENCNLRDCYLDLSKRGLFDIR